MHERYDGLAELLEVEELLALAQIDLDNERLESALIKLKLATREDAPAEAYAMLGRLYARLGLYAKAKHNLKRHLDMRPDSIVTRFQYAMAHHDAGEGDAALTILDEVLQAEPAHPPALYYKAVIASGKSDAATARETLELLFKCSERDNLFFGRGLELKAEMEKAAARANA